MLPNLNSCITEFIETAIERFDQLGFLELTAYTSEKGTRKLHLQSLSKSEPMIEDVLTQLKQHRGYTKGDLDTIYSQVDDAIVRCQGPLVMARL